MIELIFVLAVLAGLAAALKLIVGQLSRRQLQLEEHTQQLRLDAQLDERESCQPGASSDNPRVVSTTSVIESQAQAQKCVACGGCHHVEQHRVQPGLRQRLRVVELRCRDCGRRRTLYFRLQERRLN